MAALSCRDLLDKSFASRMRLYLAVQVGKGGQRENVVIRIKTNVIYSTACFKHGHEKHIRWSRMWIT